MGETLTKAAAAERYRVGAGRLQALAQSGQLDVEYVQEENKRTMMVDADDVARVKAMVDEVSALKEKRQQKHALLTRLRAKRHRETIIELLYRGLAAGLTDDLLALSVKHVTEAPTAVVNAWRLAGEASKTTVSEKEPENV